MPFPTKDHVHQTLLHHKKKKKKFQVEPSKINKFGGGSKERKYIVEERKS